MICELVNDDGTVMRGPQIKAFAEKHKLKQISVDDLIAYRQAREKLVERVGEFKVETSIGTLKGYGYVTPFDKVHHMALVHGRIGDGTDVPTRLHRANVIQDMFGGAKSVNAALARFKQAGRGVIVVLRDGAAGVPVQALPQDGESAAEAARTRAVARGRARRADPEGPRRALDPPVVDEPAHLRGARWLRDRDHGDGGAGGVARVESRHRANNLACFRPPHHLRERRDRRRLPDQISLNFVAGLLRAGNRAARSSPRPRRRPAPRGRAPVRSWRARSPQIDGSSARLAMNERSILILSNGKDCR